MPKGKKAGAHSQKIKKSNAEATTKENEATDNANTDTRSNDSPSSREKKSKKSNGDGRHDGKNKK